MAKEGQQGEPGPDRTPQAREVADGVVFTRRFRRSRPGSSITHGLAQGQQAAGCQARPRHAPGTQPAGASVPRVQSRAAEPETRVALDSRSGPPLVAWRERGLDTGAAGREKQSALPTESRGGKGLETG